MLVLPSSPTCNLLVGISGMPRHVMNGEPKMLTVGGGTPRRVASRPNAAIAFGCARKKAGFFQTSARRSSRSSGVGVPLAGDETLMRRDFVEQAELRMIDQLPFLALFDRIDGQDAPVREAGRCGCCRDR